jgi:death-on-curing protein
MRYLSKSEVISIHRKIERDYHIEDTIVQPNLLDSIIDIPKRTFFGQEMFPTIEDKAAALMKELIKLHPFLDGNKKTGFLAALMFLELNGYTIKRERTGEIELCFDTAICTVDVNDISTWISENRRRR